MTVWQCPVHFGATFRVIEYGRSHPDADYRDRVQAVLAEMQIHRLAHNCTVEFDIVG